MACIQVFPWCFPNPQTDMRSAPVGSSVSSGKQITLETPEVPPPPIGLSPPPSNCRIKTHRPFVAQPFAEAEMHHVCVTGAEYGLRPTLTKTSASDARWLVRPLVGHHREGRRRRRSRALCPESTQPIGPLFFFFLGGEVWDSFAHLGCPDGVVAGVSELPAVLDLVQALI